MTTRPTGPVRHVPGERTRVTRGRPTPTEVAVVCLALGVDPTSLGLRPVPRETAHQTKETQR